MLWPLHFNIVLAIIVASFCDIVLWRVSCKVSRSLFCDQFVIQSPNLLNTCVGRATDGTLEDYRLLLEEGLLVACWSCYSVHILASTYVVWLFLLSFRKLFLLLTE